MHPVPAAQGITNHPVRDLSLLGTEYERKKHKLIQELHLDYNHYVSQKKDLKPRELRQQPEGLSLPIDDKVSLKEKLREERNKEYNLFLQEQAQVRKLKRRTPPTTFTPGQVRDSNPANLSSQASPLSVLNIHTNIPPPPKERPPSRRDATTLTEAVDKEGSTQTWGLGHRRRRRWQISRPKELYNSEEELNTDEDEEFDFRIRRRQDRYIQEPEHKEERTQKPKEKRASQDINELGAPITHYQNNNDRISSLQKPDSMRMATKSMPAISQDKAELATGLMIGATEEQTVTQMRKEQYRQELLKQIAEEKRNKIKEKRLELRVAATGATDPEKEPDRIKQFGAVNRQHDSLRRDVLHKPGTDLEAMGNNPNPRPKDEKPVESTEQRKPAARPQMDYRATLRQVPGKTVSASGMGVAQGVPSLDYFSEDYHRDVSNMLREVAVPRVAGFDPPGPPIVPNSYKTPYDAAYYYYGTRNPLEPNLPYNPNGLPEGNQQSGNVEFLSQRPPHLRSTGHIEATHQHSASPLGIEELHADKSKQRRESVQRYQEALKQQIKENEERKRREKEEKERYDAKIEAEIMAKNPWGRSGGGAPIKDQKGNLVSDLNQMHRLNEESYRTCEFTPGAGARAQFSHQQSGFGDQPSSQQLDTQKKYKEYLKQQIEENKRRREEEKERIRAEDEKEEKRMAKQMARIQQEYEDEQRRLKIKDRQQNQSWIHEPETHQHKVEKKVRQEKEITEIPQSTEEEHSQLNYEREPSPPVPTLQKRNANLVDSRSSSVLSQERSVSAPHYRSGPAKVPQLQDGQQEVLRELSALRRCLRKEQKQVELQLLQISSQETRDTPPNRRRPRVDAFELACKEAVQPSAQGSSSAAAPVNQQNIREFNQLKYRDTASREEVRAMFPDPPTDAQSLDIQQQALLREQRREIRLRNRQKDHDFLDGGHYYPSKNPGYSVHREPILQSETTFIDICSGGEHDEEVHQQRSQPTAEHRSSTAPWRRRNCDQPVDSVDQREPVYQSDKHSQQSATSLDLKSEVITRRDISAVDHNNRTGGLSGDEVDNLSLGSALERRVSVDTVATEPWLRPGTSDAVKQSGCRERPNSRMDAPPRLTHRAV